MCYGVVVSKTVFMSLIFQRIINQKNIKIVTFKDCFYRVKRFYLVLVWPVQRCVSGWEETGGKPLYL